MLVFNLTNETERDFLILAIEIYFKEKLTEKWH